MQHKRNLILVCLLVITFLIQGFLVYSMADIYIDGVGKIIAILPDKTKESKLIRIVDREAGVVCYVLQNDTADFYSGLQCIRVGRKIWEVLEENDEDNREERHSKVGR